MTMGTLPREITLSQPRTVMRGSLCFSSLNRNVDRMCCASRQLPAANLRDIRKANLPTNSGPLNARLWSEVACINASSDVNKLRSVTFGGRASGDRAIETDGSWFPPAVSESEIFEAVEGVIGRTRHRVRSRSSCGRRNLGPLARVAGQTARADWALDRWVGRMGPKFPQERGRPRHKSGAPSILSADARASGASYAVNMQSCASIAARGRRGDAAPAPTPA